MNLTTEKIKTVHPMQLKHNNNCGYYYDSICNCEYWDQVRPNAKRYGLYESILLNQAIFGNSTETD